MSVRIPFFRKPAGVARIVVFLGNPGFRYANTRHNAGFMVCDALSERLNTRVDRLKFKALTGTAEIAGERVLLMKPQTFMNLSGEAAREAMRFYKIDIPGLFVVSDDVALPVGKLRLRRGGSAGGHNGLRDIIEKCGGDGFPRLKIGVGAPDSADTDLADYVLGAITGHEREEMERTAARAVDALICALTEGMDAAMRGYN
ncbi:MAG: aminoacyl-tRNA hydrolase [Oscillospiraceae bacterium]|jgi:PTH1 family peptidyl-tRNA hydrolase|nr:aminoacyl-tRNA hydrolase [Oscillospiraceae bacterium]